MLNRLMILPKGRARPPKDTLKSGPENDGGNSSNSGGGSSAKSGNQTPPDAVTATN